MAKDFPEPVKLPDYVHNQRQKRNKQVIGSATAAVFIRSVIIAFEFAGFFYFGSSALFMDALSSSLDVFLSLLLIFCIKLAQRPPDREHPFGHGRYEPLMGLQLSILLAIIGVVMVVQQVFQISAIPGNTTLSPFTWIIPFGALILLEICYHFVMHAAKKQHSSALATDALHYRIDSIASLFATVALLLGAFFPSISVLVDHIGAILIAIFMVVIGLYTAKGNLNQLMDHIPEPKYFEKVRLAAKSVDGVRDTEKIRIQCYGPDAHVDIDVEVDPKLSVDQAHKISQNVRAEIQKEWPAVRDVTVHIEPYYPHDH